MKKLISFAVAGMFALSLAACGSSSSAAASITESSAESTAASTADSAAADSDLAYLQNKGKMTIGYTVYEPMNYTDESGTFTGFDTELATAVCEKLGLEPDFVEINWDTKETELAAKSIDCIWNGLTLTDDREANMACTKPYVKNAQVVVMKADADYTSTADLAGKTVVAESGSAGETTIEEDEGLQQADFVAKSVQTDCLMEVAAGTADAAVLDLTLASAMIGEGTDYANLVIKDELNVEEYGAAFRKGSDVAAAVDTAFDELKADGTMQTLADKYGLTFEQDIADLVTVAETTNAANDKGILVTLYPGSPNKETWLPGVSALIQTGQYNTFLSAGQTYNQSATVVDEVEKSFGIDIKVASVGALGQTLTTAFNTKDTFGNPSIDLATVKSTSVLTSALFAITYNALNGDVQTACRGTDDKPLYFEFANMSVTSAEQLAQMDGWDDASTGNWCATTDVVDGMLTIVNPDLTAEEINTYLGTLDFETLKSMMG